MRPRFEIRQPLRGFLSLSLLWAFLSPQALLHAAEERSLERIYATEILPFYRAPSLAGRLPRAGGVEIDYRAYLHPQASGVVVLLTGRNETHLKHAETFVDLYDAGYTVFAFDHRGQGHSTRLLRDARIGHVERFDDYADDFEAFVDQVVAPNVDPEAPRFLLAHSLGGAVAARSLERAGHSRGFRAVAFVTPMFGIHVFGLTLPALELTRFLTRIGLGNKFVPGGGGYRPVKDFEDSKRTHSATRLRLTEQALVDRPELAVGAPSNRWVMESLLAARRIRWDADRLRIPALVLEATRDRSVTRNAQRAVCQKAPDCERLVFQGAFHELLHESDEYRVPALRAILELFERHRG